MYFTSQAVSGLPSFHRAAGSSVHLDRVIGHLVRLTQKGTQLPLARVEIEEALVKQRVPLFGRPVGGAGEQD